MQGESRLPYIKALIEEVGLEELTQLEVEAVRVRPIPMKLARSFERLHPPKGGLSPHELRCLKLCAHGLTRQEIADLVGCTEETIKSHHNFVRSKLGAKNMAHAVALAYEQGLLRAA